MVEVAISNACGYTPMKSSLVWAIIVCRILEAIWTFLLWMCSEKARITTGFYLVLGKTNSALKVA
jgi:hypothetical protein